MSQGSVDLSRAFEVVMCRYVWNSGEISRLRFAPLDIRGGLIYIRGGFPPRISSF